MEYYKRDGTPYEGGMLEWARDFEKLDRRVALDKLDNGVEISTVFLGLNHAFLAGPPLIFETMVFVTGLDEHDMERYSTEAEALDEHDMERYSTEAEALEGHARMVEKWRARA